MANGEIAYRYGTRPHPLSTHRVQIEFMQNGNVYNSLANTACGCCVFWSDFDFWTPAQMRHSHTLFDASLSLFLASLRFLYALRFFGCCCFWIAAHISHYHVWLTAAFHHTQFRFEYFDFRLISPKTLSNIDIYAAAATHIHNSMPREKICKI